MPSRIKRLIIPAALAAFTVAGGTAVPLAMTAAPSAYVLAAAPTYFYHD